MIFFNLRIILLYIFCTVLIGNTLFAQSKKTYTKEQAGILRKLRDSVEKAPDNLALNEKLISAWGGVGTVDTTLVIQYNNWLKKFPKSSVMSFAIGRVLANNMNTECDRFLLRAVSLDPTLAQAWFLLYKDAEGKADSVNACEYLEKAVNTDTENAQYAFYDAYQYRYTNPILFRTMALALAKRFVGIPDETGINAISVLISDEKNEKNKSNYYNLVKDCYIKYRGYYYNKLMTEYFEHELIIDPNRSLDIAAQLKNLQLNTELAKTMIKIKDLLKVQKSMDAYSLIQNISSAKFIERERFILFKAKIADEANRTKVAFDSISYSYSKKPTDTLRKAMLFYGRKLGFTKEYCEEQIKNTRNSAAKQVPDFSLPSYVTNKKINLKDYRGKVILLTIWSPTLLSNTEQFKYFDKILKKYNKNEIVCIAINPEPLLDGYALPFIKNTGYNFIPLRDSLGHVKGNIEPDTPNIKLISKNYLIDQRGRIVFSRFDIISSQNQDMLELMMSDLLKDNESSKSIILADSLKRNN